ncbi:MAG: glycosyltransferase [Bryobacteraceae bacterium]
MRIVQLVESLEWGGLERMALDLAIAQKAAGHQTFLYSVLRSGPLQAEAEAAGVPVVSFFKRPGISFGTLMQIARQLRSHRAEVVHVHTPGRHHDGAVAARLARVPVVVSTRHGPADSSGRLYQERYFRYTVPLTNRVVFVSEQTRKFLVEKNALPESKASVILNGICVDRFMAQPARPGSACPRIRFGTVGRLVPVKAHSNLIEAFARVTSRIDGAELRILGGGPLHGQLQEQVDKLGLQSRVKLEGPNANVAGFLRDLDIFVLASNSEGLPLVILEAMASGLPIVSTRVGGVPEAAPEGEVAWYCPIGSVEALAEAMIQAASSTDLSARGQRALALAASCFDISVMRRNYDLLYESCLSGKPR